MAFAADVPGLREFCRRAGLRHKINAPVGEVALFHRVLERDAPVFLRLREWQIVLEIEMPFTTPPSRREAVAARLGELGTGWSLRRGAIVCAASLATLGGVSDEKLTAALDEVRAQAGASARELETLCQR